MAFPDIHQTLDLLGRRMRDKITGLTGVVTVVSHDLYGCVQATLHPGLDKDGKIGEQYWFDVARLERVEPFAADGGRVMTPPMLAETRPKLAETRPASYDHGPAEKPSFDHKA